MLIRDGYDLFLTSNGVVLIYDDIALKYIHIVRQFPYLGLNVFSSTVWTLPASWSSGTFPEAEVRGILVIRRDI